MAGNNIRENDMQPTPVEYMRRTRDNYRKLGYTAYQWFHADTAPRFVKPAKPLAQSRLGMVSTAGTYLHGQVAYHYKDDTSIRKLPSDARMADIRFAHIMQNYLVEARQDPATVYPAPALKQLHGEGVIGDLAENYLSCMGGIYSQSRVKSELIPALADAISQEQLDLLLLVPL